MRSDLSGRDRNRLYQTEAMQKADRADIQPGRHLNAEIAKEKTQRTEETRSYSLRSNSSGFETSLL
jgi:hypothetical protein